MGKKQKRSSQPKVGLPPRGAKSQHPGCYPAEIRLKAVKLFLEEGHRASLIGEELGISSESVKEWVRRYRAEGEAGLLPRYRDRGRPQVPVQVKDKAVAVKQAFPGYGSRRISQLLRRLFFLRASTETVRKSLHDKGLVEPPKKKPERSVKTPRFFERSRPNQMWQSDIFTFRLGGHAAYLIGFIDDYSRYITGLGLYRSQTAENVLEVYRRGIGEYGVPKEMLTDNGRQYVNWRGTTRFESELKKDRVSHIRSRPHHPMTLGKIERFWKSIYVEMLCRVQFDSFEEAESRIATWVKYYNHRRPHQGIGGLCPADRFFEIQTELRKVMERGIAENALEMALRGRPRQPFYMVGRMGDQSVVIRAEKGKVRMLVDGTEGSGREMVYDIKEADNDGEDGPGENEGQSAGVYCAGEMPGGLVGMVGAEEAAGDLPGARDQLGGAGPVAEAGDCGDDGDSGTAEERGWGKSVVAGSETGEDARAGCPAEEQGNEAGEASGDDTGGDSGQDGIKKGGRIGGIGQTGPATSGDHYQGTERAEDGNGSGQRTRDLSQIVLQVGEAGTGSTAGCRVGPVTRPICGSCGFREGGHGTETGGGRASASPGRAACGDPGLFPLGGRSGIDEADEPGTPGKKTAHGNGS